MKKVTRVSPVRFDAEPDETKERDSWNVVLAYRDEGDGPWLVDLSHRHRWDYQDGNLDERRPFGLEVPQTAGGVSLDGNLTINRMNRTQVSIWHLGEGEAPNMPDEVGFTHVTDGQCMLGVVGNSAPEAMEHLSNLDLFAPSRTFPFLTQGPLLHVPCQVVTFGPDCVVLTASRGYGRSLAEAMLRSARPVGLRPGGERRFTSRLESSFNR